MLGLGYIVVTALVKRLHPFPNRKIFPLLFDETLLHVVGTSQRTTKSRAHNLVNENFCANEVK
jgi:hypothetical protein